MNNFLFLRILAFDQAAPKPGCEYTETVLIYGYEAGANEKCGITYYARQPYVYLPVIITVIVVSVFTLLHFRKNHRKGPKL